MSDLANGILVQHASLGAGKVVALEPDAVHVFFPAAEKRFATKLRLPAARAFLRTEGVAPDPWLEGLSAFTLDAESRRYALSAAWLTHEQAIARFVEEHPEGFAAGAGAPARCARWRAAHAAWDRALGNGQGERLLADGDLREIVKRALAVERHASPLHPEEDQDALSDALADPAATGLFFTRLFELLSVPSPSRPRFDRLFAAAAALPGRAESSWLVATLFPFVAQPERHPLVRAGTTNVAALRLGSDLRWDEAPNWATYAAVRTLSAKLRDELEPLGARDLVDVEAFVHETASARSKGRKARSSPRRAEPARVPHERRRTPAHPRSTR